MTLSRTLTLLGALLIGLGCGAVLMWFARPPGPKLWVDARALDMGVIPVGDTATLTIPLENTGGSTLLLRNIKTSCKCTTGLISKSSIPPGDVGTIDVIVTAKKFEGQFSETVFLDTNLRNESAVTLAVKYTAKSIVRLSPPMLSFGTQQQESLPVTKSLRITPGALADPPTWSNLIVTEAMDHIDLAIRRSDSEVIVEATLLPDAPSGAVRGELVLLFPTTQFTKVTVPVSGFVEGHYRPVPDVLVFDTRPGGAAVTQTVFIEKMSNGDEASVTPGTGDSPLTYALRDEGTAWSLLVTFSPPNGLATMEYTVDVIVKSAEVDMTERVTIPIVTIARERPGVT